MAASVCGWYAPRAGEGARSPLARGVVRIRDVRGLVGLRVVGTEALLSLPAITVPEPREDCERSDAPRDCFGSPLLQARTRHRLPMWVRVAFNLSFRQPTVTSLTADKILCNLLRRFPFRDLKSVPVAYFVIDEHMRTGTLNS